jgi:F-box and WD-40 domain protein 1/11
MNVIRNDATVYCIHVSGPWLILGDGNNRIQIWRTYPDEGIKHLPGFNAIVEAGMNQDVVLIKMVEDAHEGSVTALSVDVDAGVMVTGSSDGTAGVWSLQWGPDPSARWGWKADIVRKGTLTGHTAAVLDVALAKDFIVTCSKDTSVRIYNRSDYSLCRVADDLHDGPVNCLALHPNPDIPEFVSASGDGRWVRSHIKYPLVLYHRSNLNLDIPDGHALACIAWKGPYIVTGSKDCVVSVYTAEGVHMWSVRDHTQAIRALDLDVNEAGEGTVVSASYDQTVKMRDVYTGKLRYTLQPHTSIILDVQLVNGRLITYVHSTVQPAD